MHCLCLQTESDERVQVTAVVWLYFDKVVRLLCSADTSFKVISTCSMSIRMD